MRHYCKLLLLLLLLVVLGGCRSSRHAAKEKEAEGVRTTVSGQSGHITGVQGVTAKMKLRLEAGGKGVNCGGSCRLVRDDVVQVDLTYTLLFVPLNIGTLELTKDYILLLDKMNNRYCRATYDEIPELKAAGVDFHYLQSILWGEAEGKGNAYVDWTYGNWMQLGSGRFPQALSFTMKVKNTSTFKAAFEFSKVQETSGEGKRTQIPSDYEQVSLSSVMNTIMKFIK